MEKKPDEEPEEDAMQAKESLARTAALGDEELAAELAKRQSSGEAPLTWDELKKDLGL